MRIGLLTTSFPRALDDVPGQFVLGFARALAARGHNLEVLAPEPGELSYAAPPVLDGIDVRWVRYLSPRTLERTFYGAGVLDNLRRDPLASLGLAPFVAALTRSTHERMAHWDAVVSHWALPCALVAGALKGSRLHLSVLHSADVFLLEQLPFRRALAMRIAHGADALVFSSRDLRNRFLSLLAPVPRSEVSARAHVCAMGIDHVEAPGESRPALKKRLSLSRFTLLSLGRLIPLKGIEHAIDAVSTLPDVELVIAGDGPARATLERHAAKSSASVRFVGEVHGGQKRSWLDAADAFVLPSIRLRNGRTEGMPTSLLEAMDHGLPVIASDVGGVRDVVRDGENGLLVQPGDARAIARALEQLLSPHALRALKAGARETAAMYHWSALAPRFESLLTRPEGEPW